MLNYMKVCIPAVLISSLFATSIWAYEVKEKTPVVPLAECTSHTSTACKSEFDARCELLMHNKDTKKIITYHEAPKFTFLVLTKDDTCASLWISEECRITSSKCDADEVKLLGK